MATQRRQNLLKQRRRAKDEADDEASVVESNDSLSEDSLASDVDEDADADYSDLSETDGPQVNKREARPGKSRRPKRAGSEELLRRSNTNVTDSMFQSTDDTEVMMNGLKISDDSAKPETMDFEATHRDDGTVSNPEDKTSNKKETFAERKRRDHEEYRKKMETDPAFIPTRGAFFMHDRRTASPGHAFRGFGRGGRGGRGGPVGHFGPTTQQPEPTNSQWSHDLHDTLLEQDARSGANRPAPAGVQSVPNPSGTPPVKSFSTTQLLGKLQVRVLLPGMKDPITYSEVPVKRYTKLPNHRPPLRRDKPVRVSLPDHQIRYIFPAMERSFIFIPRNLRPNQQGFGRGRSKGLPSLGGFSSRRTSIYNGSLYSPSVAMSRRSSLARDGMASPVGSLIGSRPVVRLPPGPSPGMPPSGPSQSGTPGFVPQVPVGPQKPAYRENWPTNIYVHQPRPQKTISVTGIENPANMPTAEQQPFHHQMPQVNGGSFPEATPYSHSRHQSFAQPTVGTPLSNIPERAIHAQPFQPYAQPGAPPYPNPYQGGYYYPHHQANPSLQYPPNTAVIAPMFVPGDSSSQQGGQGYLIPTIAPAAAGQPIAGAPTQMNMNMGPSTTASGMVAHEQNGMVYYYDPSQLYNQQQSDGNPYAQQQQHQHQSHQQHQQHQPHQHQPHQQHQQHQQHQHSQHPQHPQHQHQPSGGYGMMGPDAGNYYYQPQAGTMYYPPQ